MLQCINRLSMKTIENLEALSDKIYGWLLTEKERLKQRLTISSFVTLKNELLKLTECFKAINVSHNSSALIQYGNMLELKCIQNKKTRKHIYIIMVSQTLVDDYMGSYKWMLLKVTHYLINWP